MPRRTAAFEEESRDPEFPLWRWPRLVIAGNGGSMVKRVVVIEDEPNISEAIRYILTRNGWQVDVSPDGVGAVQSLCDDPPQMLILDVMLPNISGFEILKQLRQDARTEGLPVLMLTAKGQDADRARAEALGVSRFMTKPFANSEVIAAVDELAGVK